jgi:S-(hydroxymethyl)glutathione dehydrogenase/alcohol dehydrogenase
LPHLLGHEGCGEVIEVGQGCSKVQPGDEVILGWLKGEGLDAPGARYVCEGQIINSGKVTTFSNYTVVSENRLVKKPDRLPRDVAVLFGCALPTGAGMVLNELRPDPGQAVAVLGLGGIGLSALMALRSFGCRKLIAIDISEEKLDLARAFGATHLINALNKRVYDEVLRLEPSGVDCCVESAGTTLSIETGFSLIRKGGGRLLFASHPPEADKIKLFPHDLISGKLISGSWGGASYPDRDIPKIDNIIRELSLPLDRLISRRYQLNQINDALDDLEAGQVFRPLIEMTH